MMAQKDILNTLFHDREVIKQKRIEAAQSGASADELDLLDNQLRTATANAAAMSHVATSSRASWGRTGASFLLYPVRGPRTAGYLGTVEEG